MKKTININLGGVPFMIDEDAYQLLHEYLETISHVYTSQDEATEFATDIENRIAEIFTLETKGRPVIITLQQAEKVIRQIGNPTEFVDIDIEVDNRQHHSHEEVEISESVPPTLPPPVPEPVRKRLFRNPADSMLGGVCSGIAAYLNIDPTWVRLATVALCFLSMATVAVIYLILWIVLPEANTPIEIMQMKGETPTFDSIGRTVTGIFNNTAKTANPSEGKRFADTLTKVLGILARICVIAAMFVAVSVFFALLVVLLLCVAGIVVHGMAGFATYLPAPFTDFSNGYLVLTTVIAGTLVIAIPIYAVVHNVISKSKPMSRIIRNTLVIIWIIALSVCACMGVLADRQPSLFHNSDTAKTADVIKSIEIEKTDSTGKDKQVVIQESDTAVTITKIYPTADGKVKKTTTVPRQ